jgi:hypothetical protein
LSNKSSEGTIYAFLDGVLSWFGAPTKVFINQGMEFLGKFQMLCEQALIAIGPLHVIIQRQMV